MQKSQYINHTEKQPFWLKSVALDCCSSASSTLHTPQLQKLPKFYFLYNKLFSTIFNPDKHDGVITHLEPDILESEVKWALGSITTNKARGELFQILKDDAIKVLHSTCQQIWKTQQWPQDWKRSVFISIPKKGNAKECSNYCTIALISHASKLMLKILQARLQQM